MNKLLKTFLIILSFSTTSFSQECPSCDKYLDVIYDQTSLQQSEDIKQSFATWFFTSQFESEIKGNKAGMSVTVPFEGIPFTFGGNYESNRAWEKRSENMGSTKWDFSRITRSSLFTQIATDESRNVWLQCIQYTCAANSQKYSATVVSSEKDIIVSFYYNRNLISKTPTYVNFVTTSSINSGSANKLFSKKLMKKSGEAIKFTWADDESVEGTIILNTSEGSTLPINVKRFSKANEGSVGFLLSDIGPEKLLGKSTSGFLNTFGGYGDQDDDCQVRSPDGKYCATNTPIRYTAGIGQIFRNGVARCAQGQCPWTAVVSTTNDKDGAFVEAVILNWAGYAGYVIDVDVFAKTTIQKLVTSTFNISGKTFSVSLPKEGVYPLVTMRYKNKWIYFRPDALVSDEVVLKKIDVSDLETTYSFTLK